MKILNQMKIPQGMRPVRNFARCLLAAAALLLAGASAQAHLTYGSGSTSRDFGSFTGLSFSSVTIANQTATGNFGWADAADGVLGDSHKGRGYRFHLDNAASVTLSVSAKADATGTSVGGLVPGFSIYQGLAAIAPFAPSQTTNAAAADHDGSAASEAWRTAWAQANLGVSFDHTVTDGNWNALADFKIGGDGDLPGDFAQLSSFTYKASAAATGGAGSIAGTFTLPAGDYTIIIGGNDIANKTSPDAGLLYGISATLNVTPVPEPRTWALLVTGVGALAWTVRRRQV
jgi:hypothetical protein